MTAGQGICDCDRAGGVDNSGRNGVAVFVYRVIRQFPRLIGSIRFLTANKEEGYELQGEDALFAEELYKSRGLISFVPVYREGNLLYIRNGLFHGRVATILKVDHRKQRLLLQFSFDNQQHELWVGYEECEKEDTNA